MVKRLKQWLQRLPELTAGQLNAMLAAFALMMLLTRYTAPEAPVVLPALLAMACVPVLSLALWHWKHCLVTVGLLIVAALVGWLRFPEPFFEGVRLAPDVLVMVSDVLFDGMTLEPEWQTVYLCVVAGGVALGCVLTMARFVWALPLTVLSAYLVGASWLPTDRAIMIETILLIIACIVLWGRSYGRKMRKQNVQPKVRPAMLAITAAVTAVAAVLIPLWLLPSETDQLRAPFMEKVIDDLTDLTSPWTGFKRGRAMFSLRSVGFMPEGKRLGGPAKPTDELKMLVTAKKDMLLRGSVSNYYTGESWLDTQGLRTYRFGSLLWRDIQTDYMDLERPKTELGQRNNFLFGEPYEITVEVMSGGGSTLFTTGRVLDVDAEDERRIIANFDTQGEMFNKRSMMMDDRYTVTAYRAVLDKTFRVRDALRVEAECEPESEEKLEQLRVYYMNLPEDLPEIVYETAELATEGCETPLQKAVALEAYLLENYTYTLDAEAPDEGEDFVAHFLETGEGYCTYYASAMTVMARTLGLPARYVQGYTTVNADKIKGEYHVTGEDAHAWTEVYINGLGWITFDPTPLEDEDREVVAPHEYVGSDVYDYLKHEGTDITVEVQKKTFPWLLVIEIVVGVFLLMVILVVGGYQWRWRPETVARRYKAPGDRFMHYWRDSLALLEAYGTYLRAGETALSYGKRIDQWYTTPFGRMSRMAAIFMRWHYGEQEPTAEELTFAHNFHMFLEQGARRQMKLGQYITGRLLREKKPSPPDPNRDAMMARRAEEVTPVKGKKGKQAKATATTVKKEK